MTTALAGIEDTLVVEDVPVIDTLEDLSDVAVIGLGVLNTILLFGILALNYKLPGHEAGGLWPIWIPEHYSHQTSAHPFDPYSFSHVAHGTLGFVFTELAGKVTYLRI